MKGSPAELSKGFTLSVMDIGSRRRW